MFIFFLFLVCCCLLFRGVTYIGLLVSTHLFVLMLSAYKRISVHSDCCFIMLLSFVIISCNNVFNVNVVNRHVCMYIY